ncbi:hypothetical protein [Galbibacter mesophilus]|uniref:hypothetical protein n=1 Tax=Galbibacter mesophilus TaxID=379069 RepID=UPI001920198B|nr:hypothetical protein [Galbibacter mesophilus]MCM5663673.1 hypothetical protein [Galbibacter mesophilus]
MISTYETGHAVNVAHLQLLIQHISALHNYNPPVENLTITKLQELHNRAKEAINNVENARNANKRAIHHRQEQYKGLRSLTTRIINHLAILPLNEGTLKQAQNLRNRIIGGGFLKNKNEPSNLETPDAISTSMQSYAQLAQNFSILVQLVKGI